MMPCFLSNLLLVQISKALERDELFGRYSFQPRCYHATNDCFTHGRNLFMTARLSLLVSFNQLKTSILRKVIAVTTCAC